MKTKIYIRIGQNKNGKLKVVGGSRPSYDTLLGPPHLGVTSVLPTVALKQAEQVAAKINLDKKNAVVCGTVVAP